MDMAVGCTYKYLNGGPGAPAFLYIKKELQQELSPAIQGWFGDKDPFSFKLDYKPSDGIQRFNIGTPAILSMSAIEPGLDLLGQAGMMALRQKSLSLQDYMMFLIESRLKDTGFSLGSPEDPLERGSHLTLQHENAGRICQALINPPQQKPVVIPDFRAPDSIRFGIAPLYVSYEDIWSCIDRLVDIMQHAEYKNFPKTPPGVT